MCKVKEAIQGLGRKEKNERLLHILALSNDSRVMAERVLVYADPGTLAAEAALEALAESQKTDPPFMHDL
jgi:hypothetical protein